MKVSAEQLVNGLILYADEEVIRNLPTQGKWLVGASIGIMTTKVNNLVHLLNDNKFFQMTEIIDENGMFDVDLIMDSLRESASKYGKVSFQIPVVGKLIFSAADIDLIKKYVEESV